jgi:hypothetical protein
MRAEGRNSIVSEAVLKFMKFGYSQISSLK